MPRSAGPALQKVTLNIIEGDREILAQCFPIMGWSAAARTVLHKYCLSLLEKLSQQEAEVEPEAPVVVLKDEIP